ncbi:gamma-tubulin complex component 5 [Zootermopsis nevadensis]|uniref:Gamma-tubulin complex component n=1 Tax=Zootermopsis nevadensis TaxID=136037 RepID=A0A067RFB6_ZOONE|nr:gamma-tubulin complex component 5 [Zootermopsis nevadensis]KDR22561.1 Gamma-tubulin complex component 5 [Zootermopsis nevadensis]
MAGRAKEAIIPEVRNLIIQLTKFHEGEENFDLCERFLLSNLWHHRFLSVDSHAVRRSVDGLVTKFEVHGHLDIARKLRELVTTFLSHEVFCDHPQYDIQWSLLSLLLHLANSPTSATHLLQTTTTTAEVHDDEEEQFDWTSYLREGDEKFVCVYDDSSSEEFSSDLDEPQDEGSEMLAAEIINSVSSLNLEVQNTSKEYFIRNLKDIYSAEKWMETSIMQPYWTSEGIYHNTSSRFPAANLAKLWDEHLIKQGYDEPQTTILSEYKVLREILWMFFTPSTSYLFTEEAKKFTVNPNITIPSLTKGTFASYVSRLCPYFTMLRELQSFSEDLNCSREIPNCTKFPPNTYIAYWTVVKEFLDDFNSLIIQIETKVKKRDRTYTLLQLTNELEPKLYELRSVYCVHARAVYDWKTSPNWLSASCLLSVLYRELVDSSTSRQAAILLKLFLKSFEVYLDIIDAWLTHGQLQDCREEFVITRDSGEFHEPQDEEFVVHPYETMLVSAGIQPLPVLQVIVGKLLHAGKSMDLLLRLDRLSVSRGCLCEEFIEHVEKDLSKFALREDSHLDTKENADKKIIYDSNRKNERNDFFTEVKEHLVQAGDPFLVKAFENYLPFKQKNQNDEQGDKGEIISVSKKKEQLYTRLIQHLEHEILPVKHVIETNLLGLVEEKWKAACSLIKPIFQREFDLSIHFRIIRGIFLMEAGDLMHQFYTSLFEQLHMCEATSFSLTNLLESCVDQRYPEFSSRFFISVDNNIRYATSVQDAINSIKLRYTVQWPVSLILSEHNMEYYNTVFQFLLKIKWAICSLQKLRFSDLEQRENKSKPLNRRARHRMHRLQCLRFWLLYSVNSVHSYLMGQVLHLLSLELEHKIEQAQDLDALMKAHSAYVQTVYTHCLQSDDCDVIKNSVLQMIWVALRLCEVWEAGVVFVPEGRLKELEELYSKCYIFLAVVLSNWVENDTTSHLSGLCAAFDMARLPQHYPAAITIN